MRVKDYPGTYLDTSAPVVTTLCRMDKPANLPEAVATVIRMTVAAKRLKAKDVYEAAGVSKSVWDRSIQNMDRSSALKLDQIAALAGALGVPLPELVRQAEALLPSTGERPRPTSRHLSAEESADIDRIVEQMVVVDLDDDDDRDGRRHG